MEEHQITTDVNHLSLQPTGCAISYVKRRRHYEQLIEETNLTKKYIGHRLKGVRDFTKPNYSLGSRDIEKALINASLEQQGGIKSNTHMSRLPALRDFSRFLKAETEIRRLNHIDKSVVLLYGEHLKALYEEGAFSAVTARDYLSHVNRSLAQARGDDQCVVRATLDLGFAPKSGIALVDGSVPDVLHQKVLAGVTVELQLVMQLQRFFGMRFREASLFDAQQCLRAIENDEIPSIVRGTKGGQRRLIPIETAKQYQLIQEVANYQKQSGFRTLIPERFSFKAFQSHAWRVSTTIDAHYKTHGERKYYACAFYLDRVGVPCPVQSGISHGKAHYQFIANKLSMTLQQAKALDLSVRTELSKRLGHHRVEITNAYLG
ncbi:integrase domain-containing protein [Vibrio sp. CyArs1]|uniref:integrase domain-containing protein n=1 Tax=Vibrio sp. CyArs1 TaxID=2682577 RepID=UPI00320A72BE